MFGRGGIVFGQSLFFFLLTQVLQVLCFCWRYEIVGMTAFYRGFESCNNPSFVDRDYYPIRFCQLLLDGVHLVWYASTMKSTMHPQVSAALTKLTLRINEQSVAQRSMNEAVVNAKFAGATWQQIGDIFGITRQAAYDRFSKRLNDGY